MVLATELSRHFEHVNKFVSIVTKSNSNNTPINDQVSLVAYAESFLGVVVCSRPKEKWTVHLGLIPFLSSAKNVKNGIRRSPVRRSAVEACGKSSVNLAIIDSLLI